MLQSESGGGQLRRREGCRGREGESTNLRGVALLREVMIKKKGVLELMQLGGRKAVQANFEFKGAETRVPSPRRNHRLNFPRKKHKA